MPPTPISRRALNRAFLERQMLMRRRAASVPAALEHLVGMQAQAPAPPYIGLWTRLEGFQPDDLARLVRDREAVRIALMRSTIHLVTARDALALRPVVQPVLDRALKGHFGKWLAGADAGELEAAGRALVEERPRTFAELGRLLRERWPDREPGALANAVRAMVPLVQVPPRGLWGESGPAAHTSAVAWLGGPIAADPAPDDTVLRYLGAFGPAGVRDAQVWSGLSGLRQVFERLRPRLRAFRDEAGVELFDLPDAPRPDPDVPAPPRFLPEFDNVLLSHADRTRILPDAHRPHVLAMGMIASTVLVDGFVRATWRLERGRRSATLVVKELEPLAVAARAAVAEEGAGLLAFAAPGAAHDVRFLSPEGFTPG